MLGIADAADAVADATLNTNSILLGITILFVCICIGFSYYRRSIFFKFQGTWQDSYSAVRPPGAAPAPGYFLLSK
jgi:hypothetical protein